MSCRTLYQPEVLLRLVISESSEKRNPSSWRQSCASFSLSHPCLRPPGICCLWTQLLPLPVRLRSHPLVLAGGFFWANLAAAGVELQVCGSSHDIRVDDRRRVGERTEASSERESAQAGSPFLPLSSNTTWTSPKLAKLACIRPPQHLTRTHFLVFLPPGQFLLEQARLSEAAEMAERAAELESSEFDVVFSAAHMLRWAKPRQVSSKVAPVTELYTSMSLKQLLLKRFYKRFMSTQEHRFRAAQSRSGPRLVKRPPDSFGVCKTGPQMSFPSTLDVKGSFAPEYLVMSSRPTRTTGDRREVSKVRPSA